MKKILLLAAAAVLLAGCSRSVTLTVVNVAPVPLSNVVAAGPGYTAKFSVLVPGAQGQAAVDLGAGSKAGFKLEYDAAGRHFSEMFTNDPWNGMKEIILTVTNDLSVLRAGITTF